MTHPIEKSKTKIVILDDDPDEAAMLSDQLMQFGYQVQPLSAPGELEAALQESAASYLLVRTRMNADACAANAAVVDALESSGPTHIIYLSDEVTLDARVQAIRAGAQSFLTSPFSVFDIVDKLEELGGEEKDQPFRVMIVDDDPQIARYHQAILNHANMDTIIVPHASETLNQLADFRPELILMDFYMPEIDGRELAAAIRQEAAYDSIPIVFLSAEDDRDMQQKVMRIGGDDFLTKPIRPDHLVSAILLRARRFRSLRAMMVRDSLTGLLNHTATKEQMESALSGAKRHLHDFSFAMLDIDHFKSVNDTHGHPVGDQVLRSLSLLLKQRLRTTDIIGRYGGEEFAIAMPETSVDNAVQVLDGVRESFAHIVQPSAAGSFQVTFSCGVAGFPGVEDAEEMTQAADRALYDAKNAGRNRVMKAGS